MRATLNVGFACWLGMSVCLPSTARGADENVAVSISLEDSLLYEYQTIYMVIHLQNKGTETVRNMGPLKPPDDFLKLTLRRDGAAEPLRPRESSGRQLLSGEFPGLAPGESRCEVRDLLTFYGQPGTPRVGVPTETQWPHLPPGRYSLSGTYLIHPNSDRRVSVPPVRFEVRALSPRQGDFKLLQSYLRAKGHFREPGASFFRSWFRRFALSPYSIRIFRDAGPAMSSIDIGPVLDAMRKGRVSPGRRAALIGVRCLIDPRVSERDPKWYGRMIVASTSELERCVLKTWQKSRHGLAAGIPK